MIRTRRFNLSIRRGAAPQSGAGYAVRTYKYKYIIIPCFLFLRQI